MANPPITIGPFTNVPAPGSPIKSDWPQQISQYVVDRAAELSRPSAGYIKTNAQALAVGPNTITWDAAPAWDVGSLATPTGKFTANKTGLWLVAYSTAHDAVAAAGRIVSYLAVAGQDTWRYGMQGGTVNANDDGSLSGSDLIRMTAGQTVELRVWSAVARNLGGGGVLNHFSITFISTA